MLLVFTFALVQSIDLEANEMNNEASVDSDLHYEIRSSHELDFDTRTYIDEINDSKFEEDFSEMNSNRMRVMFRGVWVAWVLDAGIEYTTGHSPSMWLQEGIGHVDETLRNLPVTNDAYVIVYPNTGNLERCDYSTGYCAIATRIVEDK